MIIMVLLVLLTAPFGVPNIDGEHVEGGTTPTRSGPRTIIVDENGTGDFTSIQDAIIVSVPGDTIRVYDGLYKEVIFVEKPLDIIGNGSESTTIEIVSTASQEDDDLAGATIISDGVNFSGFRILGHRIFSHYSSMWGIYINNTDSTHVSNINCSGTYAAIRILDSTQSILNSPLRYT